MDAKTRQIVGRPGEPQPVLLEYGDVVRSDPELLGNLSGAASAGSLLWTVSDEGRSVECLEPKGDGFALLRSVSLDALFPGLPEGEADLEGIAIRGRELWLCGSHTRVRHQPKQPDLLDARFRKRPSRHLLARLRLDSNGRLARDPVPEALPFTGPGSLRRQLRADPYLGPFVHLPSKEGGLDIEGIALWGKRVLLGLRGPVLDGIAAVISPRLRGGLEIEPGGTRRHLLDLDGRGVRDLASVGDDLLVLAGPMGESPAPFSVYRWRPDPGGRIARPEELWEWPADMAEKPEGICALARNGRPGLLVIYDRPDGARLNGTSYRADWHPLG